MTRKIILSIIIILILVTGIYQLFFKKAKNEFTLAEAVQGTIFQKISETGQVKQGEGINLTFKNAGKIEKIYVKVGDNVKVGQELVKLDTTQLYIQLKEAQANLDVIQAKKTNAQVSLESAQQNLEDKTVLADEKIEKAYKDALSVSDDSYLKIYNSLTFINYLKRTYFDRGDAESITVLNSKTKVEKALELTKIYINNAQKSLKNEDIDLALTKTKETLLDTKKALEDIRNAVETLLYKDLVSSTDKSTLDTHKLNINTVYTNVVGSQQNISTTKINNQTDIDTAQSQVSDLENQLKESEVGLYQAQINQAKAQIDILENQLEDATLKSPVSGQITKVNKRIGETVQPMTQDIVISLIPEEPFQIKVDIPEVDIGKIDLGNICKITLDAFHEIEFSGKVIEIEPAETIIQGVVYYKTKISLEMEDKKIKPGMTANVSIIADSKENVLIIPQRAVIEKNGKKFVRVPLDTTFKEVEVQTGLRGSEGEIEVISGLKEGDRVITFIKINE